MVKDCFNQVFLAGEKNIYGTKAVKILMLLVYKDKE